MVRTVFFLCIWTCDVEDRAGTPRWVSWKQTHLLECGGTEDANRWGLLPSPRPPLCFQLAHRGLAALLVCATLPSLLVYQFAHSLNLAIGVFLIEMTKSWRKGEKIQTKHTQNKSTTNSDILILTICLNLCWSCFGDPGNLSFLFTFSVCSSNQALFARVPVKSTFAAVLQTYYCRIQDRDIFWES